MKRTAAATAAALGLAILAGSGAVRAADGYDISVWQPVHDGSGAITAEGVGNLDRWDWRASLSVDYARSPLRLVGATGVLAPIIANATTGDLGIAVGLPHRFTASLAIPVSHHKVINPLAADSSNGVASDGMGDLRAMLKCALFDGGELLPGLAVAGGITAPTGDGVSWFGSNAVEGRLVGIATERLGPVQFIGNLGTLIRPRTATVWGKRVGSGITGNGGIVWDTGFSKFEVLGDAYGSYAFRSKESPFEFGGGLRREIVRGMTATVGANHGVGHALGTPSYRVFGVLSWDAELFRKHQTLSAVTPVPPPRPIAMATPVVVQPLSNPVPPVATPAPTPGYVAPIVVVTHEKLELNQSIFFALQLWDIRPESFPILDEAARQLNAHTEIRRIRIEGHTDSTGSDFVNGSISTLRAIAVKNYLVKRGVAEARLEATGYGPQRPIATNKTKEGRALNRRVEFNIQKRDASDDAPEAGEGDLLPQAPRSGGGGGASVVPLPMDTTPLPPDEPIPATKPVVKPAKAVKAAKAVGKPATKPAAKPTGTPIPAPKP